MTPERTHAQMSKKIAQLTKVIYALNSKNDDQEMQLTAVQDAYEAEIEQMLKETYTRINEFRKQLDFQKQQTDFEGKLAEYQQQRQKEKAEAVAEFDAFRRRAQENEQAVKLEAEDKVTRAAQGMDEAKQRFEGRLKQFSDALQRLEGERNSGHEDMIRAHKQELEQKGAQHAAKLAERDASEESLRAELEAALADDSKAAAVRAELEAEVETLMARAVEAEGARDANASALSDATASHAAELEAMAARHAEELAAALAKARAEFEEEASKMNNMLGERLAERQQMEASHAEALAKLQAELESERGLRKEKEAGLAAAQGEIEQLKKDLAASERALAAASQGGEAATAQLRGELDAAAARIKELEAR